MKAFLVKIYFIIIHFFQSCFGGFETSKYFKTKTKKAFLIGTPEHDNLGDHAIALAEIQFINKYFKEYEIVEISVESWRKYKINLLNKTNKEDIFFITGGGNMGNIYRLDEVLRQFIISNFKDNKVIIFPQTIYYSKDKNGERAIKKSQEIYSSHKRLLMCAREEKSFNLMKEYFPNNNVYLCPDMVFMLEIPIVKDVINNQVGICLRNDIESAMTKEVKEKIVNIAKEKGDVKFFNTCLSSGLSAIKREEVLTQFLSEISKNSVVITDRLHGVIFSIITGTPCLAFLGTSHKILSTKQWFKNSQAITIIENVDELSEKICFILENNTFNACVKNYSFYYENLAKLIRET